MRAIYKGIEFTLLPVKWIWRRSHCLEGLRQFTTWYSESRSRVWWIPAFNSLSPSWTAQYPIPGTSPTHGNESSQLNYPREENYPPICPEIVSRWIQMSLRWKLGITIAPVMYVPGGHWLLLSLNSQMPIHVLHTLMLAYRCAVNLTSISLLCLVKLTTFLFVLSIYCLHTLLFLHPVLIALSLSFCSAQGSISCLLVFSPSVTYKIWRSVLSTRSAQQVILMLLKEKPSSLKSHTHLLLPSSPGFPMHSKITASILLEKLWTFSAPCPHPTLCTWIVWLELQFYFFKISCLSYYYLWDLLTGSHNIYIYYSKQP